MRTVFNYTSSLMLTFALIFATNHKASAASAVAYGNKTSHIISDAKTREDAIQEALERCSKVDMHCKVLVKCKTEGFGAIAMEKQNGLISAIGAVCGNDKINKAAEIAVTDCNENSQRGECELTSQWEDDPSYISE